MILQADNKVQRQALKTICREVDKSLFETDLVRDRAMQLIQSMKAHNGVGLADNQLGGDLRIFVFETVKGEILTCVNPSFTPAKPKKFKSKEGCLSVKGMYNVKRFKQIIAEFTDEFGQYHEVLLANDNAVRFQHELAHLNGVLISD